jgi:hypothetical protein
MYSTYTLGVQVHHVHATIRAVYQLPILPSSPVCTVVRRFFSTWLLDMIPILTDESTAYRLLNRSQLDPIEFKHSTIIPQIPQARTIPSIDN